MASLILTATATAVTRTAAVLVLPRRVLSGAASIAHLHKPLLSKSQLSFTNCTAPSPLLVCRVGYAVKRKMALKLTDSEREAQLKPLLNEGWKMVDGRDAIHKTYIFKNFVEAWCWMSRIAMAGEKMDHHPEWFNVYNKVEVTWSTHDCGGLSVRDIKMANLSEETFKLYK